MDRNELAELTRRRNAIQRQWKNSQDKANHYSYLAGIYYDALCKISDEIEKGKNQ